jgi:hypothetical protein
MNRRFRNTLVALLLATATSAATAGQFLAIGSGNGIELADAVADLVSDKFTARYPVSRYAIHVIYDFQGHGDAGGVGFAVAGVVPRVKDSDWVYAPLDRFVVTRRVDAGRLSAHERQRLSVETIREAVAQMMQACASSPNCDILR